MAWTASPGVSFLSALATLTGEPVVAEGESLWAGHAAHAAELPAILDATDIVALYGPNRTERLAAFARGAGLASALMAVAGIGGAPGRLVDLRRETPGALTGIVLLRRAPRAGAAPKGRRLPLHLGPSAWDAGGRLLALAHPATLMRSDGGDPLALARRHLFPDAPKDPRSLFVDSRGQVLVGLKGHAAAPFGRPMLSGDGGDSFRVALPRCCWGVDEDRRGHLFAGAHHEADEPDREAARCRGRTAA